MFTERTAIRDAITFIQEERRKLSDQYWDLIKRLRELDQEDRAKGIFIDVESALGTMYEITKELSSALSHVQVQIPAKSLSELFPQPEQPDNIVAEKDTVVRQKNEDSVIKPSKQNDMKKASSIVYAFLKERGVPIKISTIFQILEESGMKWKKQSYSMAIATIRQYEPRIVSVTRGYYQCKV